MNNFNRVLVAAFVLCATFFARGEGLPRGERQYIWPEGSMPDAQPQLIAAMTEDSRAAGFNPDAWRRPYVEWFAAPPEGSRTGVCVILISGGSYEACCDGWLLKDWLAYLTDLGVTCVNLVHRTPRANGLPFYQVAWEDGQRAVRIVRQSAAARGFDPRKIGVMSMSAGSHLATLLATTSLTPAYAPVDELDDQPCNIDFAVTSAIAYGMTDGLGIWNMRGGDGPDIVLDSVFAFDAKTAPMCMFHGGLDRYSALTSTHVYRRLRAMGVPAELHLFADRPHCFFGEHPGRDDSASYDNWLDRVAEFMRQLEFLAPQGTPVELSTRFPNDGARGGYERQTIWPSGKTPDAQPNQGEPRLEWHLPRTRRTAAIQIVCAGGGYDGVGTDGFDAASVRRYLNAKGMTVVEVTGRRSSGAGSARYVPAWQDLQRAIRLVRRGASAKGLDPDAIGVLGAFDGGHLALLGATSSRHAAYYPVDDVDELSCKVQWAVIVSPTSVLTSGGMDPTWRISEFPFDPDTCSMLFVTGDSAACPALASVKCWEHLRRIGLQSDLHVLELSAQDFPQRAAPGTGGFTWLDRVWEFMNHRAVARDPKNGPVQTSGTVAYWPLDSKDGNVDGRNVLGGSPLQMLVKSASKTADYLQMHVSPDARKACAGDYPPNVNMTPAPTLRMPDNGSVRQQVAFDDPLQCTCLYDASVAAKLTLTNDFTVEGWFLPESDPLTGAQDNQGSYQALFATDVASNARWHLLLRKQAGETRWKLVLYARDGNTVLQNDVAFTGTAVASLDGWMGAWRHLALVHRANGGNGKATWTLYLDGVAATMLEDAAAVNPAAYHAAAGFSIGGLWGSANRAFRGCVDQVRVCRAALRPTQFLNAQTGAEGATDVLRYWPLNVQGGVGVDGRDATGQGADLSALWNANQLPKAYSSAPTVTNPDPSLAGGSAPTGSVRFFNPAGGNDDEKRAYSSMATFDAATLELFNSRRAMTLEYYYRSFRNGACDNTRCLLCFIDKPMGGDWTWRGLFNYRDADAGRFHFQDRVYCNLESDTKLGDVSMAYDSQWHHVAIVREPTETGFTYTFYHDGGKCGTNTTKFVRDTPNKATALVVGGRWWNNSNSMDGALASLRVTEGALTTNEFLNASAKWPSGSVATSTTMLIR